MTTRVVRTPLTDEWRVRRRWLPHREGVGVRARFEQRKRWRAKKPNEQPEDSRRRWFDYLDPGVGCVDDVGAGLVVFVVVVLVVLIVIGGGPVLLLGIDLLWLLIVGTCSVLGRIVLRRPWSVEAAAPSGERREWKVRGFRDAGRLRDVLAGEFERGLDPRPDDVAAA